MLPSDFRASIDNMLSNLSHNKGWYISRSNYFLSSKKKFANYVIIINIKLPEEMNCKFDSNVTIKDIFILDKFCISSYGSQ